MGWWNGRVGSGGVEVKLPKEKDASGRMDAHDYMRRCARMRCGFNFSPQPYVADFLPRDTPKARTTTIGCHTGSGKNEKRCAHCKGHAQHACARCGVPYCSVSCQITDWRKGHDVLCKK